MPSPAPSSVRPVEVSGGSVAEMMVVGFDRLLGEAGIGQAAQQIGPLANLGQQPAPEPRRHFGTGKRRERMQHAVNWLVSARREGRANHARQRDQIHVLRVDAGAIEDCLDRPIRYAGVVLRVPPALLRADQQDAAVAK